MAPSLVSAGLTYNVDPRLIVAIAGAESTFGTNWVDCPPSGFNAWSWLYNNHSCPASPFSSFADGIQTVTQAIRTGYLDMYLTSIPLIASIYCGAGCSNWIPDVTLFYTDLGGNLSDLTYSVSCTGSSSNCAVAFQGLGFLPGGNSSTANGVSADGSVVVGSACSNSAAPPLSCFAQAFRWTQATGMIGLGFLAGDTQSAAMGVNADGSVIVGQSGDFGTRAFRWTASTGMASLGTGTASAVNADGSVVVGNSYNSSSGQSHAFRWTAPTGLVLLGAIPGDRSSSATGVSSDGSVVVGQSCNNSTCQAFRWTQATGMIGLGFLPGATISSGANGVSSDGSVVVGFSKGSPLYGAFIVKRFQSGDLS